jgi:hypothetical protein
MTYWRRIYYGWKLMAISKGPISRRPISGGPISRRPISRGPISGGPISGGPILIYHPVSRFIAVEQKLKGITGYFHK